MKIAPARVLDVGVGFGRWGILVREFAEVWEGRVFKDQWTIRIEGIEAFPRSVGAYHREFYDQIHIGDAATVLPPLPGPWNLVIFGDSLEHVTKDVGRSLLSTCLERADYVLVNVPLGDGHPQGEAYGNPFERHLSAWDVGDFDSCHPVRRLLMRDYIGRPYGSFVLSRADPKDLRTSLYAPVSVFSNAAGTGGDLQSLAAESGELRAMLDESRAEHEATQRARTALRAEFDRLAASSREEIERLRAAEQAVRNAEHAARAEVERLTLALSDALAREESLALQISELQSRSAHVEATLQAEIAAWRLRLAELSAQLVTAQDRVGFLTALCDRAVARLRGGLA